MTPITHQCTLKSSAVMNGLGLHTGGECRLTISPAEPDSGILFVTPKGEIPASARFVGDTLRGTTLKNGEAEIHTVEHVLAALTGKGVDNARIEVTGPEVPAADGSALPFVHLIEEAGIMEQDAEARFVRLDDPMWVADSGKYLLALPSDIYRISMLVSYQYQMVGEQAISITIDPEVFKREIAPARTFCSANEIEMILSQGLGKGGTEDNVIVVHDDHYSIPLRFDDEFVRHKVLDLIGDLSLTGGRLLADITAIKTSHKLNTELAQKITDRKKRE